MTTRMIEIARIDAGDRLRRLSPDWVSLIAEEIAAEGQHDAIRVVERGSGYRLVDGALRLAALVSLGRDEVEAKVQPAQSLIDDAAVRLAEIKAGMLRAELSALDHAMHVASWCEVYRDAHEPQKSGPKPARETSDEALEELSAKLALNWTEAAQTALNVSRRGIFRALKIATVGHDLLKLISLHPVSERQSELLLLAEQTPIRQRALVDILTREPVGANSVTDAIAVLDQTPAQKPVAIHEKLQQRFTALKPEEQEKFLNLNADIIERWMAKRLAAQTKRNAA